MMTEPHETFGPSGERRCSKCARTTLPDQCGLWIRIGRGATGIERFLCETCGQMFGVLIDAYEYGELDSVIKEKLDAVALKNKVRQMQEAIARFEEQLSKSAMVGDLGDMRDPVIAAIIERLEVIRR